jgi:hypothetical protein
VTAAVSCGDAPDRVLGAAMVVSSRKGGTLVWGHASLRIVACVDGAVSDLEYETYRLGEWNEDLLRREHAGEPWVDGPYLATQRGALVLFRNVHPVDAGWFGDLARENRELWEVWLDLPPDALSALSVAADQWYRAQRETFRANGDLPERYVPWRRNCTAVLRDLLPALEPGSALPFAWLRALEGDAALRVVHPSLHLLHQLPADVHAIPRRRVTFRRSWPVPEGRAGGAALGPW